jgi:hypothetical protein
VFDPVRVTDATCAPVRDAVLLYPPPAAGTARGEQAPVGPSACSGGGWFMTPAGLRRVLEGLIGGTSMLSGGQRRLMDDNCLGWDCSVTGTIGNFLGKTGGCCGSSVRLQVFFGILAGRIPVVVVLNSTFKEDIATVVQSALYAATSHR